MTMSPGSVGATGGPKARRGRTHGGIP
jgi:hypothetical protein